LPRPRGHADVLKLPDTRGEQPGADDVVEEVGLALLPGILDGPGHKGSVGNRNSCEASRADSLHLQSLSPSANDARHAPAHAARFRSAGWCKKANRQPVPGVDHGNPD
jgi:hypothetical protein